MTTSILMTSMVVLISIIAGIHSDHLDGTTIESSPRFAKWVTATTYWPSTASSFGPHEAPRRKSPVEVYRQFLQQCPPLRTVVEDQCSRSRHSCRNHCGHRRLFDFCRCDVFCQIYKDCCWDFKTECPHIANNYEEEYGSSPLANTRVTCMGDLAVIEACTGVTFKGHNKTHEEQDLREPVVTVQVKLVFRNRSVAHQCVGTDLGPGVYSHWVHRLAIRKGTSVDSIRDFILYGDVNENLELRYHLFKKDRRYQRRCSRVLKIKCPIYPENHGCNPKLPAPIQVVGSEQLCGHLNDKEMLYFPLQSGIVTPPTTMRTASLQIQTVVYDDSPSCQIFWYSLMQHRPLLHEQIEMGLLVDFRRGVDKPSFDLPDINLKVYKNEHLKAYECEDVQIGIQTVCNITARCQHGFIPINLICRKPGILLVRVVGIESEASSILEDTLMGILTSLTNLFPYFRTFDQTRPSDVMYGVHNDTRYKSVINFLPFQADTPIPYEGDKLPVTVSIRDQLRSLPRSNRTALLKLDLCFTIEENDYYDRELLCDRLLVNSRETILDRHETIPGIALPDPFADAFEFHKLVSGRAEIPGSLPAWFYLVIVVIFVLFAS